MKRRLKTGLRRLVNELKTRLFISSERSLNVLDLDTDVVDSAASLLGDKFSDRTIRGGGLQQFQLGFLINSLLFRKGWENVSSVWINSTNPDSALATIEKSM